MKGYRIALLLAAVAALFFLMPTGDTRAGLGISGQERVRTLDVYLDPLNTGSVSYTVHLANGLAIEGSGDTWEHVDQMMRLSEAMTRPNTTVTVDLKESKITGIMIRSGAAF
jgi:hypothetical protein